MLVFIRELKRCATDLVQVAKSFDLLVFIREQPRVEIPKTGEVWELIDKSPLRRRYVPVMIVEVIDGWVRYDIGWMKDQMMDVDMFVRIYRRCSGEKS